MAELIKGKIERIRKKSSRSLWKARKVSHNSLNIFLTITIARFKMIVVCVCVLSVQVI